MIVVKWGRLRARLAEQLAFQFELGATPPIPTLRGLLASADASDKKAVLIGSSAPLADHLGLAKVQRLTLRYPDFTLENLALMSAEYDFVIADRALHLMTSLDDAASETIRVLKSGGWFVATTGWGDFSSHAGLDARRLSSAGLQSAFPHAEAVMSGRAGAIGWIAGRKMAHAPTPPATTATRRAVEAGYRFRPRRGKFALVAMLRNEAPYLLEWIAHHRLLGFDNILLYDNQSTDASARILAPLSRAGIISAVYWPDRPKRQDKAYAHAIKRLRRLVDWCLFIDLDEFLVPRAGVSLDDLLPKEPDVSALAIAWRVFGSSGFRNRDPGLTLERYLRARATDSRVCKSLVRLRDIKAMAVHLPRAIDGRVVDVEGHTVERRGGNKLPFTTNGAVRIHHYQNRSREEFEVKRARGTGAFVGAVIPESYFDRIGEGEIHYDDALRLIAAVKEEMARLRQIVAKN